MNKTQSMLQRIARFGSSIPLFFRCAVLMIVMVHTTALYSLTLVEIVDGIEQRRRQVNSLRLLVERTTLRDNGADIMDAKPTSVTDFAFSGEKRYLKQTTQITADVTLETIDGSQTMSPESPAVPDALIEHRIYDGFEFRYLVGQGVGAVHSQSTVRAAGGSNFDLFYLTTIGWHISDPTQTVEYEVLRGSTFFPETLTAHDSHYAISPSPTVIDGTSCVELRGGFEIDVSGEKVKRKDAIWCAPELGYMLIRREVVTLDGSDLYRITTSGPLQILGGIYIPEQCVIEELDSRQPRTLPSKRTVLKVKKWEVNFVDEDLFKLEFPNVAMVADHISAERQGKPKDRPNIYWPAASESELDSTIGSLTGLRTQYRSWVIALNFILVVVLIVVIIARRCRAT